MRMINFHFARGVSRGLEIWFNPDLVACVYASTDKNLDEVGTDIVLSNGIVYQVAEALEQVELDLRDISSRS